MCNWGQQSPALGAQISKMRKGARISTKKSKSSQPQVAISQQIKKTNKNNREANKRGGTWDGN